MLNAVEFFRNLPKKHCQQCGVEMVEQADCYGNTCHECSHPAK